MFKVRYNLLHVFSRRNQIGQGFLHGALERWAPFFSHPLLTESATLREINAVNSGMFPFVGFTCTDPRVEHSKNLDNDDWRFDMLLKNYSNPLHPYHAFTTGKKVV